MKRVLLAIVVLGLFASCALAETYDVASDTTWPPFEWVDSAGHVLGFDLDLMRCIAVVEGFDINIMSYDWDIIFDDVGIGRVDIGASGATITEAREQKVDFSAPYWTSDQAVLIRADSGLNIVTALSQGHTVGAQIETTGAGFVQELIDQGVNVKLKEYTLYPLSVIDLINGNVDAVIQDEPASEASAKAEDELTIAGVIKTNENFGFFVAEGDPKGLLPLLNDGVEQLKANGVYDNLVRAYMGTDITQVEAAWVASIGLLNAGDVEGFAQSLAELSNP